MHRLRRTDRLAAVRARHRDRLALSDGCMGPLVRHGRLQRASKPTLAAEPQIDPSVTSLLLTEPLFNLPNVQENYDQVVFEEYEFDAYQRLPGPRPSRAL